MAEPRRQPDLRMNADGLYLEELFTDRRVGTLQRLTPVDAEGKPDPGRKVVYVGQTQILTPAGGLPISFEIEATSLKEAAERFAAAARAAVEDTLQQLEELRREAASGIIVPGAGGAGGLGGIGGPAGPGGMPPGGIRMP